MDAGRDNVWHLFGAGLLDSPRTLEALESTRPGRGYVSRLRDRAPGAVIRQIGGTANLDKLAKARSSGMMRKI